MSTIKYKYIFRENMVICILYQNIENLVFHQSGFIKKYYRSFIEGYTYCSSNLEFNFQRQVHPIYTNKKTISSNYVQYNCLAYPPMRSKST